MTLKLSSYLSPKFSRVPFTIVLIPLISTMVNGTLLNFGKRYENDLRVIFDQWPRFGCAKQSKNFEWCLICNMLTFATLLQKIISADSLIDKESYVFQTCPHLAELEKSF